MKAPSFYAVLTANVRYDKRINFRQKVLFAEITALTQAKGYCYASNSYFAELYDTTPETISRDISKLKRVGYLKIHVDQAAGNSRRIYPQTAQPIDCTIKTIDETIKTPIDETIKTPIDETVKYNNTSINNTRVNKKKRAREENQPPKQQQSAAQTPTPNSAPDWMAVAKQMAAFYEGEGKDQWEFMCMGIANPPPPIQVTRIWAGKHQDAPYMLNHWRRHTGKLTNWIRNESNNTQKAKSSNGGYQPANNVKQAAKTTKRGKVNLNDVKQINQNAPWNVH